MERTLIKETLKKINQKVLLKGWVRSCRDHGKIFFLDIYDRSGLIQVVAKKETQDLKPEDVVEIMGKVKERPENLVNPKIETGTVEIEAREIKLLSSAETLPFDTSQDSLNVSLPTLLDYRALTLRHPKVKAIFKIQEAIIDEFRQTLKSLDFTEIFVPTIVSTATEGGAEIFPVKYFDRQAFLAQSPQFYKQIMVSVFERVFTVAHAYRAEPSVTTRHLTEYIGLDAELGFINDWREIMEIVETVIKNIFKSVETDCSKELKNFKTVLPETKNQIPRLKLREAQEIIYKTTGHDLRKASDLDPQGEKEISKWCKKHQGSELVFITHYPTKKRPFYTQPDPKDPSYTLSFDLIGRGVEWVTGSQRINDYEQLISNIKKWGYNPKNFETPYLQAFKFGMPPEGGFCLGLERITQNILGLKNVREASLFPRDMERVDISFRKVS